MDRCRSGPWSTRVLSEWPKMTEAAMEASEGSRRGRKLTEMVKGEVNGLTAG